MRWMPLLVTTCVSAACAARQPQANVSDAPLAAVPESRGAAANVAGQATGSRDSIQLAVTEISLQVGEAYLIFDLAPHWRDATGAVTRMGRWKLVTPETDVFEVRENRIWGRRAGEASLHVEDPTERAADPSAPRASTRVMITVRP